MINNQNKNNWIDPSEIRLESLESLLKTTLSLDDLTFADRIDQQVPIYDTASLIQMFDSTSGEVLLRQAQAEWQWIWDSGPGILVFKRAFEDDSVIDNASAAFDQIIAQEKRAGCTAADHFAKAGANDRIWNALEKQALIAPVSYVNYYKNRILSLAAMAWLGPGYQITAQVNSVNPGSEAQVAHRDYHLGFMPPCEAIRYPAHVHRLSPSLTLQCAIAHVDMPLESGPTLYLPHSQKYSHGYVLSDHAAFQRYFSEHCVQLPLEKGDLVMFNPALLHAAGANISRDINRMANLLQISSAFGRAMESVDRTKICLSIYESLLEGKHKGSLSSMDIDCVIAASADGYPFPTNLDRDPPINGLAPLSQQAIVKNAVLEKTPLNELKTLLEQYANKRCT